MEQPRAIRRQFCKLDVSFDQTYVGTPTTRGYSHNTIGERIAVERRTADFGKLSPGPVDAFTGWHIANGERTDYKRNETDKTNPKDKDNGKIYEWGWVANLAVRVDSEAPGSRRFPTLVVAASLSIPNREVAEEAVDLLRAATTLDMEPGVADADKQYWVGSTPTRLLKPALKTGFTPSTDYKKTQLGVKGGQHGALAVEGDMYCPSTEKSLLTASEDLQKGIIDIPTYRQRIDGRRAFALHVKQKAPTPDGNTILRCPALGPSPTVTCPLRELMKTATPKTRPHVEPESLDEEMLDTICRKHSASFDLTEMQQPAQAFDYGSKEWEDFHEHARNTVESENQQLKAAGDEDIQTAGRRRVRGISAAQIIITLLLVNHNIRKIGAFLDDELRRERKNNPTEPTPLRRRDRAWQNKYTKTTGDGDLRVRNTKELRRANDPVRLRT